MKIIPILLLILFALSTIVEGNDITGTVKVVPAPAPPIVVAIEINPKIINPNSSDQIKVTVFNNTPFGFDVASINISTVRFGPNGATAVGSETSAKKLNIHFNTQDTGIKCGDTQANLTGKTYIGQNIFGSDNIRTTECTKKAQLPVDPVAKKTKTKVTATSPSGNVTLTVPNETIALDKNGNPLANISLYSRATLPATASVALSANNKVVGDIVNLGPEGARFDPPIHVRFNYTEPLPSGVSEDSLEVRFFNTSTNSWESLTIVESNTVENYVIADITHFSTYTLLGTVAAAASNGGAFSGGDATKPTPIGFALPKGEGTVSLLLMTVLLIIVVILRLILRRKG